MAEVIKEEEVVKFEKTASGKLVYTIKLVGRPEDNLGRLKELKKELDMIQ